MYTYYTPKKYLILGIYDPTGTRIPIAAVKGQCPDRLDDRAASCIGWTRTSNLLINSQTHYHCATIQCASLDYKVLANPRQLMLPKQDFHLRLKV